MHHPRRKAGVVPGFGGSVAPGIVNRLDGHDFAVAKNVHRVFDQMAPDSLAARFLTDVYSIDDPQSARFNDRWHRFPFIDAPDKETRHDGVSSGDQTERCRMSVSRHQPLRHLALRVRLELHIRTPCSSAKVKPGPLDLRQI